MRKNVMKTIGNKVSCPNEKKYETSFIPKLTLCHISTKLSAIVRYLCKFCCHKSHNGVNAVMKYYSPSPGYEKDCVLFKKTICNM